VCAPSANVTIAGDATRRAAMEGSSVSATATLQTIELRIHGVSGTPPEDMLNCSEQELVHVAGDKSAGFYRRASDIRAAETKAKIPEAYSWGGLTSGSASRALWLLFLPFIFVNLAHWMLPLATKHGPAVWSVRLLRLLGLSLTLTFLLASVSALMDVVAWQCGYLPHCGDAGFALADFTTDWSAGSRLVTAALPLAAVVWAILWLGKSNPPYFDDEAERQARETAPPDPAVTAAALPPLSKASFWAPDGSEHRLRLCHVVAWNSALGATTLFVVWRYARELSRGAREFPVVLWLVLIVLNLACLAIAVLVTFSNKATARGGDGCNRLNTWLRVLVAFSTLCLIGALAFVFFAPVNYPQLEGKPVPDPLTSLPGLHALIYVLLLIQVAILMGLFASMLFSRKGWNRNHQDGDDPTLNGYTAFFVAAIALLVGGGMSAGVVLGVAQFFGRPVLADQQAQNEYVKRDEILTSPDAAYADKINAFGFDAPLAVPPGFALAAIVFVVLVILLLFVCAPVVYFLVRRHAKGDRENVKAEHGLGWLNQREREEQVAMARAWAWLPDIAPPILAIFTGGALLAYFLPFAYFMVTGWQQFPTTAPLLSRIAVPILAGAAAGIVVLVVLAVRNRQTRRTVGILWDVITFWPRANHPLTPPCYGQRAVPDMRVQTKILARRHRVVISAHSQGSIITAAALLSSEDKDLVSVALLTYGSPLRRLFGRNFPAYFGAEAMRALEQKLPGKWINLWAASDPIGQWVSNPGRRTLPVALREVDFHMLDVERLRRDERGSYAPICGHSGFRTRPAYAQAVDLLGGTPSAPSSNGNQTRTAAVLALMAMGAGLAIASRRGNRTGSPPKSSSAVEL
jgi:hypothetical protein